MKTYFAFFLVVFYPVCSFAESSTNTALFAEASRQTSELVAKCNQLNQTGLEQTVDRSKQNLDRLEQKLFSPQQGDNVFFNKSQLFESFKNLFHEQAAVAKTNLDFIQYSFENQKQGPLCDFDTNAFVNSFENYHENAKDIQLPAKLAVAAWLQSANVHFELAIAQGSQEEFRRGINLVNAGAAQIQRETFMLHVSLENKNKDEQEEDLLLKNENGFLTIESLFPICNNTHFPEHIEPMSENFADGKFSEGFKAMFANNWQMQKRYLWGEPFRPTELSPPSTLESFIPFCGSIRSADYNLYSGDLGMATIDLILAGTDLVPVPGAGIFSKTTGKLLPIDQVVKELASDAAQGQALEMLIKNHYEVYRLQTQQ